MANCPECGAVVVVDEEVEEGQRLDCPECEAELEVVNADPLELDTISREDEQEEEEEDAW